MTKITKNIKQYFEAHKDVNELFFTNDHLEDRGADQLAFFKEETANTHARNLKDKTVTKIARAEAFADVTAPEGGNEDVTATTGEVVATKRNRKGKGN